MSKHKLNHHINTNIVAVKSKFESDFLRFSVNRNEPVSYEDFKKLLTEGHNLEDIPFNIWYVDSTNKDLLPINNDNNLDYAILAAKPVLKIIIQRQGDGSEDVNDMNTIKPKNLISSILGGTPGKPKPTIAISQPQNFRQVSAIIDVDKIPDTQRRVKLLKYGEDKPLGFYIKDGETYRVGPNRVIEKVPAVFISRLVPGGLAEGTGLLAVNDEVLEVNGIEVAGKTLDQVTDMMIANSSNLIITVKPANQKAALNVPRRGSISRTSQLSSSSQQSMQSAATGGTGSDEDADEIKDLTGVNIHDDATGTSHHHNHHNHFSF